MSLFDWVSGQPWAIHPAAAAGLLALAERDLDGFRAAFAAVPGAADPEAVNTRANPSFRANHDPEIRDGVGVIPVRGPISRYATIVHAACGGASVQALARSVREYADNPSVRAILLHVDSPGGQVTGVGELAAMIRAAGQHKPVVAYVEGSGCSAAYWLAAACSKVVAAPTAMLGSIGVVVQADTSRPKGQVTFVSSQSPGKRMDLETPEGASSLQSLIDATADEFIASVAEYRGVTADTVKTQYGRGGVMLGRAAVDAGLADAVGDFETVLARLSRGEPACPPKPAKAPAKAPAKTPKGATAAMKFDPFAFLARLGKSNPDAVASAAEALAESGADMEPAAPGQKAPAADAERIKADARAEAKAESDRENREAFARFLTTNAEAWFTAQVEAGRAQPAERAAAVARYVDAAVADQVSGPLAFEGGTATRLSGVTGPVEKRDPKGWGTTAVAPDAQETPAKLAGFKVLSEANTGQDTEASEARVKSMLATYGIEAKPAAAK